MTSMSHVSSCFELQMNVANKRFCLGLPTKKVKGGVNVNDELERALLKKYPRIFSGTDTSRELDTHWVIECGDGWYPILEKLCEEIQGGVVKNYAPKVKFTQIKEKFGELRIYYSGCDQYVEKLIDLAVVTSKSTCEQCGAQGASQRTCHGWIKTFCTDCFENTNKL